MTSEREAELRNKTFPEFVEPLGGNMVIRKANPIKLLSKRGRIHIPQSAAMLSPENGRHAEVVKTGPDAQEQYKPGDLVMIGEFAGLPLGDVGSEDQWAMIHTDAVIARISKEYLEWLSLDTEDAGEEVHLEIAR